MKNKRLFFMVGVLCAFITIFSLGLSPSRATTTRTIYSNDFSSYGGATYGAPTGWSGTLTYYGWLWTSYGYNGTNGSMATCLYYYNGTSTLKTQTFDASLYGQYGDTVLVDFDYFLEEYYYDWYYRVYYGYDQYWSKQYFRVFAGSSAGSTKVMELKCDVDYTAPLNYSVYTGAYGSPYPSTTSSYWKHAKIGVPIDQRASDMYLQFQAVLGGYYSGTVAIDNLVITGIHQDRLKVNPTNLNFGSVPGGNTTAAQTITISNPSTNGRAINISSVSLIGSTPQDFTITHMPATSLAPGTSDYVSVTFSPKGKDLRQALVHLVTDGDQQATIDVDVRGIGLVPFINSDVPDLFRGTRTRFDNTISSCFVIRNTGGGNLTISPNSFIGGDWPGEYAITRLPSKVMAPGTSDTVCVSYTPHYEGFHSAVLNIVSNADNGTLQVQLRGTGILPRLTLSPSPFNFGQVGVGDTMCTALTLYNPGTDTLSLSRQYLSSADKDFTFTPLVPGDTLIPPEKSKQIQVCFHPIRNGSRIARLRFTTNIPLTFDSPRKDTGAFVLDISGTGVPYGNLAIGSKVGNDSTLIGTEVCRIDTFTNTGASALTISAIQFSGANATEFSTSGLTFPIVLQPGQKLPFSVCATPSARGSRTATAMVSATSNDKAITVPVPVSVYGQQACSNPDVTSIFQPTMRSEMDTATVTVTNCGDVAEVYTAALTGSDYQLVGPATSASVAPGQTATYTVTYSPSVCGPSAGSLMITGTNGIPAMTVTVNGSGVGQTYTAVEQSNVQAQLADQQGTQFTVTVTNTGTASWTPGSAVVTGPFTVVGMTPTVVAPNGTATVTLKYVATQLGQQTGTLSFPQSAPQECTTSMVNLVAEGVANGVRTAAVENGYRLEQNYPNPFNPTTEIRFTVPKAGVIHLRVVDVMGRQVAEIANGRYEAGQHSAVFNGAGLESGTYFYELTADGVSLKKSMVLNK